MLFGTKEGLVKRTLISEFDNIRQSGKIAITLKEDDELIYSIRIFCIKNDNKEEDFFEKLNDWFIISSKIDYKCYLKTMVWDNTRKKKLKEAGYKCQLCSKTDAELHVHHNTYERIGDEDMNDLIVLCESCHKKFHNID